MTILRADGGIALTQQWSIALRGDLPFVVRNPVTADNPAGQYVSGLGDADVQAALIRQFDSRWAAGAGLRFVAATGAEDITGGKWRALPVAGARYSLPEWSTGSYAEALLRYDASFAGDPSRRNVSNLQLAPMLNINLPNPGSSPSIQTRKFASTTAIRSQVRPGAYSCQSMSWSGAMC